MVPQEQCLLSLEGHTSHVFTVDFCPGDPNVVVSGGYDHSLRIWDLRQKYCVRTIPAHAGPVSSVSCSFDGLSIASGSFDGVWYVRSDSFHFDLCFVLFVSYWYYSRVWDIASGSCRYTFFNDENTSKVYVQLSKCSRSCFRPCIYVYVYLVFFLLAPTAVLTFASLQTMPTYSYLQWMMRLHFGTMQAGTL